MFLREYETIYILRPDLPDEGMAQINERMAGILSREGAKILRQDVWGKKKLAFEVKKHPKGVYVYLNYLVKPDAIREIERNLRLNEQVLTYQTVKIADCVDVDKRMQEKEAEDQARAAAEAKRKAEGLAAIAAGEEEEHGVSTFGFEEDEGLPEEEPRRERAAAVEAAIPDKEDADKEEEE